jgi:hemerythrin-like metal-binding protein
MEPQTDCRAPIINEHMKYLWEDKYLLGIKEIDEQHQQYFRVLNRIEEMLEKKEADREELQEEVGELADYAFYHFATEEKYLKEYDCSVTAVHIQLHDVYREKMRVYLEASRKGNVDVQAMTAEIAEFAANWLTDHILKVDRLYVPCFMSKGKQQGVEPVK